MKEIYTVSDLHGHYEILKRDLKEAGYDENNENHLLVVCGDCFDRSFGNLEIYKYLKRLTDEGKAIVVKGNHETMLIRYLEGTSVSPFDYMRNGTDETLASFLQQISPFESWCISNDIKHPTYGDFATWIGIARGQINVKYPELLSWLRDLPYYYETENYIFAHSAIDLDVEDWHQPCCEKHGKVDWEALLWDDGNFIKKHNRTGKTIIVGHFSTSHLRQMHSLGDYDDHSILKTDDNKVFIDGCAVLSKKINVFKTKDKLL